jgi:hypothetical protein
VNPQVRLVTVEAGAPPIPVGVHLGDGHRGPDLANAPRTRRDGRPQRVGAVRSPTRVPLPKIVNKYCWIFFTYGAFIDYLWSLDNDRKLAFYL